MREMHWVSRHSFATRPGWTRVGSYCGLQASSSSSAQAGVPLNGAQTCLKSACWIVPHRVKMSGSFPAESMIAIWWKGT